jgi:uncharacterized membrane protein YdcZ (DUF606 family)
MYAPASLRSQAAGQIWRLRRAWIAESPVWRWFGGFLAKTFINEYIFAILY